MNQKPKDSLEKVDEELKDPNIPESKKKKLLLERQKIEMYRGPIPPPAMLREYNEIVPGSGKKILDSGLKESEYRRSFNNKNLNAIVNQDKRRDWMAFIIGLLLIIGGFWLIYIGHKIVGSIFSGATAISLVGLFLGQSNSMTKKDKNNRHK